MPVLTVVPAPAFIEPTGGAPFRLAAETAVVGDPDACTLLRSLLSVRTATPSHAEAGTAAGATTPSHVPRAVTLRLDLGGAPESYRIESTEASVTIAGADAAGLFYGVHTLTQLIFRDDDGWALPAVTIDDAPRFRYRGVMLDVARHFHGPHTVKAYIDRAASLKFNALHLHLTDDQGWRLQLRSRPALTEKASATAAFGDDGGFYTQDDYREIVAYAAAQHMIVVPEIDVPGHTHAVSLAYPELCEQPVVSDPVRQTTRDFGGELPVHGEAYEGIAVGFSSLKIREEATYAFLADVLDEVTALTRGPYVHVGGDEALGTPSADYAVFMRRVTELVAARGKTPLTWHEAGATDDLAPGTIGQYWGFVGTDPEAERKAGRFVAQGSSLILSPADAIYLDMTFDADAALGLTWANGPTTARRAYEWDPAAVIPGVADADILGVEAPLWSETVRTLGDIDALAFPRIAAAAEAAWSPAVGTSALRTWHSFSQRVGALAPLWTSRGFGFTALPEIPWRHDLTAHTPALKGIAP